MSATPVRFALLLACIALAGCEQQPPASDAAETASAVAPATPGRASLPDASCARWDAALGDSDWGQHYRLGKCLRQLAAEDWTRAVLEAKHIQSWQLPSTQNEQLLADLTRFESAAAVYEYLLGHRLLGGDGSGYVDPDAPTLTVMDWLDREGRVVGFDTETGTFPNRHDLLLEQLAALFGEPLAAVEFTEQPPADYDSDDPYRLTAQLQQRNYQVVAQNHGDWYDVEAVLGLLNQIAKDQRIELHAVTLPTGDQTSYVLVAPPEGIFAAVTDGVLRLEATPAGMARGKAFEQQVRDALGL